MYRSISNWNIIKRLHFLNKDNKKKSTRNEKNSFLKNPPSFPLLQFYKRKKIEGNSNDSITTDRRKPSTGSEFHPVWTANKISLPVDSRTCRPISSMAIREFQDAGASSRCIYKVLLDLFLLRVPRHTRICSNLHLYWTAPRLRGLDCEPRLLFTGSRDTFVSFHLRGGRREGEGKLTYFQLLKLLNPSRLRAPILPSFFIPCLKPSSHSRRIVPPSTPIPAAASLFLFLKDSWKYEGSKVLSLSFSFLSCIRIVRYFSRISFLQERMIELANDISFCSCNFKLV